MDLTLLLLVLGFVIFSILIFKLIKKIIFAVITFIFLIVLTVASVFGLVYLDFNHLSSQSDFNVNLIYGNSENPDIGISLEVKNKSLDYENFKRFDISTLKDIDLNDGDNENFYIFFDKKFLANMLKDDGVYYLEGTKDLRIAGMKIETGLTKDEYLMLLDSQDSDVNGKFVSLILEKNSDYSMLGDLFKEEANDFLKNSLKSFNLDLKEALFLSIISESFNSNSNLIEFIQGFKENDLEVYPNRFTFTLIKMLPTNFLTDKIESISE